MKKLFSEGMKSASTFTDKAINEVSQKFSLIKEVVNGIPFFVSSEKTDLFGKKQYDERHYFVIPFMLNDYNIALHSMRCLPNGVPEINALPKRRVFHFPNAHSEALVQKVLIDGMTDSVVENYDPNESTLINLANNIDALDKRLTYGMLFVGGMAALVNPIVGVVIAAKALTPGVTLLSKYGLRPAGEKSSRSQLASKVKDAETNILKEFKSSSTIQVINPILQELELALNTSEAEHDPLIDFDMSKGTINELDSERWRELTETAIYHMYKEIIATPAMHTEACLGPEDIRWLKVMLADKES